MATLSRLTENDRFVIALTALAWLAALAFAAWLAAHWYWRLAAPANEFARPRSETDPLAAARLIAARHLFGDFAVQAAQGAVSEGPGPLASRFKVLGVMTRAGDTPGFAIVQEAGQASVAAIEGRELTPGVKVERVLADGVEVSRGGVTTRLPLTRAGNVAGGVTMAPIRQNTAPQMPAIARDEPDNQPAEPPPAAQPPGINPANAR